MRRFVRRDQGRLGGHWCQERDNGLGGRLLFQQVFRRVRMAILCIRQFVRFQLQIVSLTNSAGISRSILQADSAELRRAWNILTQVKLANNLLYLAAFCRSHKYFARYLGF